MVTKKLKCYTDRNTGTSNTAVATTCPSTSIGGYVRNFYAYHLVKKKNFYYYYNLEIHCSK